MLHEFAVDPDALTNFDRCAYILDQMGVRHGRMISEFPQFEDWGNLVRHACSAADVPPFERKRIIEKLRAAKTKLMKSDRLYRRHLAWLVNAEQQDEKKPFHAIIAAHNPSSSKRILVAGQFGEDTDLWNVPREMPVPRTAEDLAACVAPIFRISREILLVDYRFDPSEPDWRETLKAFIRVATHGGRVFRRCEYHLSLVPDNPFNLKETCATHLSPILPRGFPFRVIRWKRLQSGERLHPRYILTEIGGVRIEKGLDVGKPGETTDVSLLDTNLWNQRWAELQRETAAFDPLDEWPER